jgi:hypothetical protein|tara:strand:+ start:342 stop:647 length:306 start_codon:yes stop_codon:yes gene_type:complete
MSDNLFSAELRDCARVNETVSIDEHHRRAMEAAKNRTYTAEEIEMYESLIEDEEGYEWEEVESDDGHREAYLNACDQGHDWDDYDDPINLYGEDGYFGFNG